MNDLGVHRLLEEALVLRNEKERVRRKLKRELACENRM